MCRDIRCSFVSGPPYLDTHGSHSKRLGIFEHSNSCLFPPSIGLSPFDRTSTSSADADCASAFPASNAHKSLPNISNHSMTPSNTEISCAMHGTTDNTSRGSSCASSEASEHSPLQVSGFGVVRPSSCSTSSSSVVKEATTRARSPAVEVAGLQPMKKGLRGNSVKQYHRLDLTPPPHLALQALSGVGSGRKEA